MDRSEVGTLRVFHGKIEIAGQMGILSGELKRRGHLASGYNIFQSYLGYRDHLINTTNGEIEHMSRHLIHFFDMFHFHYASSMLPDYRDLELIHRLGKPMLMHHWGNDVRFHEQARLRNPYVYTGDSPANEVMDARLKQITRYIKEAIVQDYEVYDYVAPYYEKVHVIPIAIDLTPFPPSYPPPGKPRPLLVHAPTNPAFKGTEAIEAAVERLRARYDFDYRRIEHMNHEEAIRSYREADIVLDQIRCGSHGLLSVEAMALGKPVVVYVRDDLLAKFPKELPIVNANPDTVEAKIEELLRSPSLRLELGLRGRKYAETHHAKEVVADRLLEIYARLIDGRARGRA